MKKEWYEKIKNGEKKIEYREVKQYWNKRFYNMTKKMFVDKFGAEKLDKIFPADVDAFTKMFEADNVLFGDGTEPIPITWKCKLRLGYTSNYMSADITKIEVINGKDTDLHIDKPVYAIHIANVREEI